MKILAFSDWRIQPIELIIDIVTDHKPDMILYAGDDLDRFVRLLLKTSSYLLKLNYPDMKPVIGKIIPEISFQRNDILQKLPIPFYYVNGNDDFILYLDGTYYIKIHNDISSLFSKQPEAIPNEDLEVDVTSAMERNGIYAPLSPPLSPCFGSFTIRKKSEEITIFGCKCKFGLKSEIENKPMGYADIYISHLPPLGTLDLSARFGIEHIGSKKLLDAIKEYHPKLVICGHSHMWGGKFGKIGDTLIINVSSQDKDAYYGNYALINTDDWSVEMKTVEAKTMRPIRGMSTIRRNLKKIILKKIIDMRKKADMIGKGGDRRSGDKLPDEALKILSHRDLCNFRTPKEFLEKIEQIERFGIDTKRVKERIESISWKKPKILRKITINPDKHGFVDVETGLAKGPKPGKLWLIGLWYRGDLRQYLFPEQKEAFFIYLKQNQITSLVSWTPYDHNVLRPVLKRKKMIIRFLDACQRTSNCVTWHTYNLHELYNSLFSDEIDMAGLIPGRIAGLYADHLFFSKKPCPYCPPKEEIIEQIKEKNRIDILQMVEICKRLWHG